MLEETHSQTLIRLIRESRSLHIVEVGVNVGDNASAILDVCHAQLAEMFLVDPYQVYDDGAMGQQTQQFWDDTYVGAMQRLAPWLQHIEQKVKLLRMPSVVAAQSFPDGKFDLVFLDGAHDKQSVMDDIDAWRPKIRRGGLLTGHDFCTNDAWGVKDAVYARFMRSKVSTPDPYGNIWLVRM